jgi:alpha-beta hydrolase superfamily lysophospholipase
MATVVCREVSLDCKGRHVAAKAWGDPSSAQRGSLRAFPTQCVLVIAIHGWLDNAASFDRIAPAFAKHGYYFVALDLQGHGLSAPLRQT